MQYVNRLIRSDSYNGEADAAGHLNDLSKLLLPFESKAGGIKQNLDHLNIQLDSIPQKLTAESINNFQSYSETIKTVESRILGVTKELSKIQTENRRFVSLHNENHPSMVRMRNVRFGNITQLAKRVTDRAVKLHSFLEIAEKRDLTGTIINLVPGADGEDLQAFLEGWHGSDTLLESIKGPDALRTVSALRQRRNTIQSNSRTLVQLHDHMHKLSSILATHEDLINGIDNDIEEQSLNMNEGQSEFERMIGASRVSIKWRRIIIAVTSIITLAIVIVIIVVSIRRRKKATQRIK